MRKTMMGIALILLVIVTTVISVQFLVTDPQGQPPQLTMRDRVLQSGVIRSAYLTYPPYFEKDPNTGEFSGIFYEITNEVGKRLGLEVQWTEEVGYGTMLQGLKHRYEIIGCGIWPNSQRARAADFSRPVFFSPVATIVRADDGRFTGRLELINSPHVTVATIDGEMSDLITQEQFPNANLLSLPQISHVSQNLLAVVQKKADVTFSEPHFLAEFLENNPSSDLQNITREKPIRIFGNTIVLPHGESDFKAMIDAALEELINTGFVETILQEYEEYPGTYYRVVPEYIPPKSK